MKIFDAHLNQENPENKVFSFLLSHGGQVQIGYDESKAFVAKIIAAKIPNIRISYNDTTNRIELKFNVPTEVANFFQNNTIKNILGTYKVTENDINNVLTLIPNNLSSTGNFFRTNSASATSQATTSQPNQSNTYKDDGTFTQSKTCS